MANEPFQQLIHSTFEFFLLLSSFENILLHSIIILLTILDNAQHNKLLSLLPRKFIHPSLISRGRNLKKAVPETLERSLKGTRRHNGNRTVKERFIIELNAQPSFIIFSYLLHLVLFFVLRSGCLLSHSSEALEINWKKILSFNFKFCFFIRVPSLDRSSRFLSQQRERTLKQSRTVL